MKYCQLMVGFIYSFLQCFALGGELWHTHSHCFKVRFESLYDRSGKGGDTGVGEGMGTVTGLRPWAVFS